MKILNILEKTDNELIKALCLRILCNISSNKGKIVTLI